MTRLQASSLNKESPHPFKEASEEGASASGASTPPRHSSKLIFLFHLYYDTGVEKNIPKMYILLSSLLRLRGAAEAITTTHFCSDTPESVSST